MYHPPGAEEGRLMLEATGFTASRDLDYGKIEQPLPAGLGQAR